MNTIDENKGLITNIQRFSVDDGPGIRTTVFFKGCNLKCLWCHNPECISNRIELQYLNELCTYCGKCVEVCPNHVHSIKGNQHAIDRSKCNICGKCVDNCSDKALKLIGESYSANEIMKIIEKDRNFYIKSGGGVTFSGGEPMLQTNFLKSLLILCKNNGINTAVDTAGNVDWVYFNSILKYTDLFLFDIKFADPQMHKKYTGVDNKRILNNLTKLSENSIDLWLRIPFVPGINDNSDNIIGIAKIINKIRYSKIELLPYHKYGINKYDSLGLHYKLKNCAVPDNESLNNAFKDLLASK